MHWLGPNDAQRAGGWQACRISCGTAVAVHCDARHLVIDMDNNDATLLLRPEVGFHGTEASNRKMWLKSYKYLKKKIHNREELFFPFFSRSAFVRWYLVFYVGG